MPQGQRVAGGSDWPLAFNNSLDYAYQRGTILKGYMTTDRQGDTSNSTELTWRLTNRVGLVKGPWSGGTFSTPWHACSIWEIVDPDPLFPNKGSYLRCSTFPDSGPGRSKHMFRSFNAVRDNSYSIISYAAYIELRERKKLSQSQSIATPSSSSSHSLPVGVREMGIESSPFWDPRYAYEQNSRENFAQPGASTGGGAGSRGSGSTTSDTDSSTAYALNSSVRLVVRMPVGYAGVGKSTSRAPGFVQTWREDDGNIYTEEFLFRYIPQNIKYDSLASEWVEIPRAENFPFVDWARWQLMKVSMSFLIASDRVEPGGQSVPDGMSTAVEPEIQKLRQMAQRKVPITFINMDELLTVQLRRGKELGRGLEFVINDMSVTATRRVTDFTDGYAGVPSGIAVAQVEMTFTEVPVEKVSLVYLPPIGAPPLPVPNTPPGSGQPVEYARLSLVATGGPNRVTTVYTEDANT
jgi:hypothetical protein